MGLSQQKKDLPRALSDPLAGGEPLRILLVTNMYPEPDRPGWGAFVKAQVEALRRLGHRVEVLHLRGKSDYLTAAKTVYLRTRRQEFDVVHAHYGLSGLACLLRHDVPMVVTFHGSDALVGMLEPSVSFLVRRFADRVVSVSTAIQKKMGGVLIPCGVDLELFKPRARSEARRRLGIPSENIYILFPYDPHRKVKRFDLVKETLSVLHRRRLKAEALIVKNASLEEMPWYFSAANAFVLCSDSEGSPTALKEALACNLPAAVTDVGDVKGIVAGIDSVAICAQEANSLASGLEKVLKIPANSINSRNHTRKFDQIVIAKQLLDVYKSTLDYTTGVAGR